MRSKRQTSWHTVLCVCIGALLAPSAALPANPLIEIAPFSFADKAAARDAWRAQEKSPGVTPVDSQGLQFPCPFKKGIERAFWDHQGRLDLSPFTSFELELDCPDPAALRSLAVYFKSGKGWYIWNQPLPASGRQILLLSKNDFSTEGKPAGWHKIDAIRISPWKGAALNTVLTAYALRARVDSILLVKATTSAKDAGEKNASKRATARISRWLGIRGIPHAVVADDQLTPAVLAHTRVLVLCYNPELPKAERSLIADFVRRGGKLMVFYSADEELAGLMHMKLGAYKAAQQPGQWSSFVFPDAAAHNVPERVFQESWNIRPVQPRDESARVIAWWVGMDQKNTADPAWVESEQGLWMTHILLDDDAQHKQDMLIGLLARLEPQIWPRAAWTDLQRAGRIDSFTSLGDAIESMRSQAARGQTLPRTAPLLTQAQETYADMLALYERGQYPAVVQTARRLRAVLIEAYASAQVPAPGEFRGVWDHGGAGWYPGDWDRTCRVLAQHGMTAVLPNIAWGGVAHYDSKVLPVSKTAQQHGDQLAQCVKAAHARGLEVHAWKICWNLEGAPAALVDQLKREGRLQQDFAGATVNWLNPAHPANRAMELNALKEIAGRYEVDGVHLDYIRYPDAKTCGSPYTRKVFEQWLGRRLERWPQDVTGHGAAARLFRQWRAEQITSFTTDAARELRAIRPGIRISAAVYPSYPSCAEAVAQDWGRWMKEGLLDFACPMSYTAEPVRFAAMTGEHLARGRALIYPGIGVTSSESQLTPDLVIEEILAARQLGAKGYVLFKLDPTLRDEVLPQLSKGLTRTGM